MYTLFRFKRYNFWFWPFYDQFWSFLCQLHKYISQNFCADGHFEALYKSKSWLDQKLQHNISQKFFFQCLKMHHFRAVSPKWVLRPQKEISCHIFKMAILTKFFDNLMNHITREYAGKKIKLFLNVSPLTIVHLLLWPFKVASLYFKFPPWGPVYIGFVDISSSVKLFVLQDPC